MRVDAGAVGRDFSLSNSPYVSYLSSRRACGSALALSVVAAALFTLACHGGDSTAPGTTRQGLVVAMALPGGAELYSVDPDNGSYSVFLKRRGEESLPSWSPDGKTIYFATDDGDGGSYLVDADGTNLRRIPGAGIGLARWSPDGTWLFMTGADGNSTAVIAERVDGTERHSLTPGITLVTGAGPSWSRDGRIAFTRTNAANDSLTIWTVNVDGTGLSQLTTGSYDQFPVWSPDGKFVAFTAAEPTGPSSNIELHVVVVNADGSGRRVLTTSAQSSANAMDTWSPDGRWLLYRRWNIVNGVSGCSYYKIPSSGGTPIRLLSTAEAGACLGATWR